MGRMIVRWFVKRMEWVYIRLEQHLDYPNDNIILGMPIDEDLQGMSRKELCDYIVTNTPGDGSFWELDSTTKIRFGCQMLRDNLIR
jgi:hypothetical protein